MHRRLLLDKIITILVLLKLVKQSRFIRDNSREPCSLEKVVTKTVLICRTNHNNIRNQRVNICISGTKATDSVERNNLNTQTDSLCKSQ